MNERSDGETKEHDQSPTTIVGKKKDSKVKITRRCFVGEHAVPQVRWVEDATCPVCGGDQLMDANGMALCVQCNKFVKPKKAR